MWAHGLLVPGGVHGYDKFVAVDVCPLLPPAPLLLAGCVAERATAPACATASAVATPAFFLPFFPFPLAFLSFALLFATCECVLACVRATGHMRIDACCRTAAADAMS